MQFKEIVGNEHIKDQLIRSAKENRISHAQLFLGPEGSGALSLAIAYAQFIGCENKQEDDSCGQCASCRKYQKFIHPDLHFSYPFIANKTNKVETSVDVIEEWRKALSEDQYLSLNAWLKHLDVENKQPNIPIAECHAIIQKLSLKPFESEFKVLIMWLPEFLGNEGNSLLKIIEEPSHKTLFLLVAENRDKMLNTILSRTQLIKINKLSNKEIQQHFMDKHNCDSQQANRIAYLANGNMSAAYAIFNEEENKDTGSFADWMRLCYTGNGTGIVKWVEDFAKIGRERQKNFIRYGLNIIRDCLLYSDGAKEMIHLEGEEMEFVTKFSALVGLQKGELLIKTFEEAIYHVERNANPKILFLDVSLQINRYLKTQPAA
ncbi:DNA polymerase III subunit tau [compost metagenome]